MEDSTTGKAPRSQASLPRPIQAAAPSPAGTRQAPDGAAIENPAAIENWTAIGDNAALRHELTQLERACARLKSHPGLVEMLQLVRLSPGHADILLGYAEQLAVLMRTVERYTMQLEQLAAVDVDAVAALIIAKRTVAELEQAVTPVIAALHRHALLLVEREDSSPSRLH